VLNELIRKIKSLGEHEAQQPVMVAGKYEWLTATQALRLKELRLPNAKHETISQESAYKA